MSLSRKDKNVVATLIPFLLFQLPMVPALLLLEGGAYSSEIGEHGRWVGATLMFFLYLGVSLLAFAIVYYALPHKAPPPPDKTFVRSANMASVLLLAYYAIPVLVYGPAFLTGQNRYQFLDNPWVQVFNVKLYLGMICVYHGWMLRTTRKWTYLLFFLAVLAVMVAWGEKFSGPQYSVVYFVAGLALAGGSLRRLIMPLAILTPIVLAIWALPTLLADRGNELVDAFSSRLARQGQVFYKVVEEPPDSIDARSSLEVLDYFGSYTPHQNGMNYLKDRYIADDLRDVHEGSFAAGFPAIVLSGGLFAGMIIVFLLEIVRFLLMREILIVGFQVQSVVIWPVYFYLLNYIGKIFESGNTYLLTSPVFFGMVIVVYFFNRIRIRPKSEAVAPRPAPMVGK